MHECLSGPPVKIGSRQHHLLYYFAQMWRWETRTAASAGRIANIHGALHHLKALKVFLHLLRLWQKTVMMRVLQGMALHSFKLLQLQNLPLYWICDRKTDGFFDLHSGDDLLLLFGIDPSCPRCPSRNSLNSNAIKGVWFFFLHCHTKVYQLLRTKFQHWLYKLWPSSPRRIKAGGWKRAH